MCKTVAAWPDPRGLDPACRLVPRIGRGRGQFGYGLSPFGQGAPPQGGRSRNEARGLPWHPRQAVLQVLVS